jgi:uncharacterized membrane protein YgcG
MTPLTRCLNAFTSLAALTVVAMSIGTPLAAASGSAVPFKDTNIRGTLTFCNRSDQPITSGSLDTAPFAWKTVSSVPPPAGYRGKDARATLNAFQPIQFVDPGDWTGGQLTGSSSFTNVNHPSDQATNVDAALLGFTQAYPLHWDGLVEIRMFYSAFNKPPTTTFYPAAILKVTGGNWTQLTGGGGSCTGSSGVSDESLLLPKKDLRRKHVDVPAGSPTPSASSSAASGSGSSSNSGNGGESSTGAGGENTAAQSSNSADSSGLGTGTKAGIGLGIVAVAGLLATGFLWLRRRLGVGG